MNICDALRTEHAQHDTPSPSTVSFPYVSRARAYRISCRKRGGGSSPRRRRRREMSLEAEPPPPSGGRAGAVLPAPRRRCSSQIGIIAFTVTKACERPCLAVPLRHAASAV